MDMESLTPDELAELHRLAYHFTDGDLLRALKAAGLPVDLINIQEAVGISGATAASIRRLIRRREFPAWRSGRRYLVSRSHILSRMARIFPRRVNILAIRAGEFQGRSLPRPQWL